nr:unnamed protein product [Callosobruchus analis]
MAAENVLYQKLVKEMDTRNAILQENCTLLKEKVELLQNQVYKNKEDYRRALPVTPVSRATTSTASVTSLYSSVARFIFKSPAHIMTSENTLTEYASMKVNIRSDLLKDAWKKDVWPSGVVVSRFFVKRRIPPQQDPQQHI